MKSSKKIGSIALLIIPFVAIPIFNSVYDFLNNPILPLANYVLDQLHILKHRGIISCDGVISRYYCGTLLFSQCSDFNGCSRCNPEQKNQFFTDANIVLCRRDPGEYRFCLYFVQLYTVYVR